MPKLTLFDPKKDYSTTVLIVDDEKEEFEATYCSFKASFLENNVLWLESGEALIDYLLMRGKYTESGHKNPVLIFLDCNMPSLNGQQTLEKLKELRDISDLRIVLLTAVHEETIKATGLGHMPYIKKPLDFEKMYEYVMSNRHFLFL